MSVAPWLEGELKRANVSPGRRQDSAGTYEHAALLPAVGVGFLAAAPESAPIAARVAEAGYAAAARSFRPTLPGALITVAGLVVGVGATYYAMRNGGKSPGAGSMTTTTGPGGESLTFIHDGNGGGASIQAAPEEAARLLAASKTGGSAASISASDTVPDGSLGADAAIAGTGGDPPPRRTATILRFPLVERVTRKPSDKDETLHIQWRPSCNPDVSPGNVGLIEAAMTYFMQQPSFSTLVFHIQGRKETVSLLKKGDLYIVVTGKGTDRLEIDKRPAMTILRELTRRIGEIREFGEPK